MPRCGGPRLPRTVLVLGWISLLTDVTSEMAYPVIPVFLATTLAAPGLALGFIEGTAEAVVNLVKGWSGLRSDRLGRRVPFVRLGYGLAALSKPLLALAWAWPMVLLARGVDRLGKGLRTSARDAMVADAVDQTVAGRAYGFHRAMDTAGAMLGALAAMGLLALLPGRYRTIFLVAALPGLASVALTFRLRETRAVVPSDAPARSFRPHGLPRAYWLTLLPLALFALANSSDAFLLLKTKSLGLSDTSMVLAYVLYNLVYALTAYPLGALSDRWGRWPMILLGWGVYAGVYWAFATADATRIWLLFPVYGLYMGLTEGAGRALVAAQAPPERRGAAMGIFQMGVGLMSLGGSLAAGWLWDRVGPAAPFRFGAVMALAAALFLLVLAPWRRKA